MSASLQLNKQQLDNAAEKLPKYIVVEGPIGVGKTTLTKRLAETFNYQTLLEDTDNNPFLEKFYKNPKQAALQTQLFFLMQRADQLHQLRQTDMFEPVRVADFLMEKDRLFAKINLDDAEYKLYEQIYTHLTINAPTPDLVIYLQAPTTILQDRINQRGIQCEQGITDRYLDQLNSSYAELFHYYDDAPLLIVNAADIDLVKNDNDYHQLVNYLLTIKNGRHYFNPRQGF